MMNACRWLPAAGLFAVSTPSSFITAAYRPRALRHSWSPRPPQSFADSFCRLKHCLDLALPNCKEQCPHCSPARRHGS